MPALVDPSSGQIIQASHITQLTGLVRGTVGKGQNVRYHRQTNLTDYANIVGNMDTIHGYALKVIAGDPDGSPTTLGAFNLDGGLTLRTGGKALNALEHALVGTVYPFVQSQDDYASLGVSVGTSGTPLAATVVPILNIQHRTAPDAAAAGGLASASNFLGSVRYGTHGDSGTATGAQTGTTLKDTGKAWAVNAWAGYKVYIYSGTGSTQVRTITSNTSDTLTVSVAWVTNPVAASSLYTIDSTSSADHSTLSASYSTFSTARTHNGLINNGQAIFAGATVDSTAGTAGRAIGVFMGALNLSTGGMVTGSEIDLLNYASAEMPYWSGLNPGIAGLILGGFSLNGASIHQSVGILIGAASDTASFKTGLLFGSFAGNSKGFGIDFADDWGGAFPIRLNNTGFIYALNNGADWSVSYGGLTSVSGGTHPHFPMLGSDSSNRTLIRSGSGTAMLFQSSDGNTEYARITPTGIYPGQVLTALRNLATNGSVAADGDTTLLDNNPTGFVYVFNNSLGLGHLFYSVDGTVVVDIGGSAAIVVGTDSASASSTVRCFVSGGVLKIRNRYATAQNLSAVYLGQ